LREQKESESKKLKEDEENQDVVREIIVIEFVEQIGRKEQLENDKNGEKNHNKGKNVGRDRISEHQPEDSPP